MALKHGTSRQYRTGCRCDECREYKRGENKRYHERYPNKAAEARARYKGLKCPDDKHGTAGGYMNYQCRCDACQDWKRTYFKARKLRLSAA